MNKIIYRHIMACLPLLNPSFMGLRCFFASLWDSDTSHRISDDSIE